MSIPSQHIQFSFLSNFIFFIFASPKKNIHIKWTYRAQGRLEQFKTNLAITRESWVKFWYKFGHSVATWQGQLHDIVTSLEDAGTTGKFHFRTRNHLKIKGRFLIPVRILWCNVEGLREVGPPLRFFSSFFFLNIRTCEFQKVARNYLRISCQILVWDLLHKVRWPTSRTKIIVFVRPSIYSDENRICAENHFLFYFILYFFVQQDNM